MFVIAQAATYTVPVKVFIPSNKGKATAHTFTAEFRRLPMSEIEEMNAKLKEKTLTDTQLLQDVMVGWGDDVQDADGNPLPFNERNFEALLDVFPTRGTLVQAFMESLNTAAAKN
jgi:hypothetical protein